MNRSKFFGMLSIGIGFALEAGNFSMVTTAIPTLARELNASFLELQWFLNIFGIFISCSLMIAGRLADTYGRKKVFLVGLILSSIGSLLAGSTQNPGWIIFAQAIQGVAGGTGLAISHALICNLFPDKQRAFAISIWASIGGVALGFGPIISGIIITFLGWRWIFLLTVPICIFAIIIGFFSIKESKSVRYQGKIDLKGLFFLMILIASFVLGISQGSLWGWTSIWSFLCLAAFLISVPMFIYIEKRNPFPIIHAEFFLKKDFLLPSISNSCILAFAWTAFFLFPLYFQKAQGNTPLITGLVMLSSTMPLGLFSYFIGKAIRKIGAKSLILYGFGMVFFSVILQFFMEPASSLALGLAACFLFGLGWLFIATPTNIVATSCFPLDLAGIASGTFITMQELGATVGFTIASAVFRANPSPFMDGYYNALWVMLIFAGIGTLFTLFMKGRLKEKLR